MATDAEMDAAIGAIAQGIDDGVIAVDHPERPTVRGDARYAWPRPEVRHLIATLPVLPRGWMRGQASR